MKKLFAKFIEPRFTDKVNNRVVNLYECKDGTRFLAHSKFESLFFSVNYEKVEYNSEGIKVEVGEISKYNKNLPLTLNIKKHVSGELQWSTQLNDFWYATFPNTEMFDVEIYDSQDKIIYTKKWDIFEHGNHFYKSLYLYNKNIYLI